VGRQLAIPVVPSILHRLRYAKHKTLGQSYEQIATEEKVSPKVIQHSVAMVETYRGLCDLAELEACQIAVVVSNYELERLALNRALQAVRRVRDEKTGKVLYTEQDHQTQLQAVNEMTQITESLNARRLARFLQQQQTTNVNIGIGGSVSGGQTYEDRLREIQRKRKELEAAPSVIDVQPEQPTPEPSPNWDKDSEESA